jgi:hypothetical protein
VRNQLKQYLSLRLPPGAEMWSAFVGGQPVKPTQSKDGTYRIPLAKSQWGQDGQQGFPVEVIYYRAVPKFLPVGYRAMSLPMPDAPVSRMVWSLYLPEKYRFAYFGGDVEKGQTARTWNALSGAGLMDRADLAAVSGSDNEAPQKGVFKKELRSLASKMVGANAPAAVDEMVARQTEVAEGLFQSKGRASQVSGIFPVAFEIPVSGQMFHFGQVMIVGQDPTVTMTFLHMHIVQVFGWVLMGVLLMGLYRVRARVMGFMTVNVQRLRALRTA